MVPYPISTLFISGDPRDGTRDHIVEALDLNDSRGMQVLFYRDHDAVRASNYPAHPPIYCLKIHQWEEKKMTKKFRSLTLADFTDGELRAFERISHARLSYDGLYAARNILLEIRDNEKSSKRSTIINRIAPDCVRCMHLEQRVKMEKAGVKV